VYVAPDEEMVREHARQGQFPADSVARVRRMIDPTTAEDSVGAHTLQAHGHGHDDGEKAGPGYA
jgi:hypothetical protein